MLKPNQRVIIDVEADALDPEKTNNIWCICYKDIDTQEQGTLEDPYELSKASLIVGHNIIGYDYHAIQRHYPGSISKSTIADTLVLSRLFKQQLDDGQGHSLEAWGNRFKIPKHPSPAFDHFSPQMLEYCKQDVEITYQLYMYLRSYMQGQAWKQSIDLEMSIAWLCNQMHATGFRYDRSSARVLYENLQGRLRKLDEDLGAAYQPKERTTRIVVPRLTKHGTISRANLPRSWTDLTSLVAGVPVPIVELEFFNPGSTKQIVERLDGHWSPTVVTKSGKSFKICEENLATLHESAPEAAKSLVERLLIASRIRTLDEWEAYYRASEGGGGRIHGTFNHIGTWTGRMSHVKPNLSNVAAPKSIKYKGEYLSKLATDLGRDMRSLWIATPGWWLIGTDAESIQLRILAHYIQEQSFIEALINGDKSRGTDPHSINARILDCNRDTAKTFIYAFILGAGDGKSGEILGVDKSTGARRKREFIDAYPGLRRLKERTIPDYARAGGFQGLDGRFVRCKDEHLMLAAMLQSGETVVMKHANLRWRKQLEEAKVTFRQLNFVHDEWQTECRGTADIAKLVGEIQSRSIRETGRALGVRCPLSGSYRVGKSWLETH